MTGRLALLCLLALLAAAPAARADSNVTFSGAVAPGTIVYTDSDNEVNHVTVERTATKIVITETGPTVDVLTSSPDGAGCVQSPPNSDTVVCNPGFHVTVSTGAQGDTITFRGSPDTVPGTLLMPGSVLTWTGNGEGGADTLVATDVVPVVAPASGGGVPLPGDPRPIGVTLNGAAGADTITGSPGRDILTGGDDADTIAGAAGDDDVLGEGAADTALDGGPGTDRVSGGAGDDLNVTGGAGSDGTVLSGSACNSISGVFGGAGNDVVRGGDGNDAVCGGDPGAPGASGNDTLHGEDGNDSLEDGDLSGAASADLYDGGDGSDTAVYGSRTAPLTVTLADDPTPGNDGEAGEQDRLRAVENVAAGSDDDTVTGSAAANLIDGGAGADTVLGGDGPDTLTGGAGDDPLLDGGAGQDTVSGNAGDDVVEGGDGDDGLAITSTSFGGCLLTGGAGDDVVRGGAGDDDVCGNDFSQPGDGIDRLEGGPGDDVLFDGDGFVPPFFNGAVDADQLDGGDGRDRVMYDGRGDAVTLTLGNDVAPGALTGDDGVEGENDALRAIEDATTGFGDDVVTGSAASNSLVTGAGNDAVTAAGGNDSVMSGGGNDTVDAGDGDDGIVAGDGDDSVTGGEGADSLEGGDGADSLNAGGGIDGLNGGAGADALTGGDGDDALDGGGGADQLVAGPGDDVLTDGDGAHADGPDLLDGGDGHDLVSYALRLAGVTVDLAVGGAVFGEAGERDTVVSAESATGGRGGDTLLGSGAGNELIGGGGDDTLDGRDGGDALSGEAGDDSLTGGSGADSLGGGAGADLFATSDGTADRASCGIGPDTVNGDPNDVVDPDCETVNGTKLVVRTAKCRKVKLNRKLRRNRNKIRATCTLDPAPARGTTATLSRGSKRVAKGKVALGGKLTLTGKGKKWPGGKKTLILRINRQNVPYTNNL